MPESIQAVSALAYLQADHRRLDQLMDTCRAAMSTGDTAAAVESFSRFGHGLTRHIKIEEEMLFPELEAATGLGRAEGPTGVMRREHAEIVRLLGLIKKVFAEPKPDPDGFERLRLELVALLHEHNMKEERIVYPMTDTQVPADRLAELVRRMRSF